MDENQVDNTQVDNVAEPTANEVEARTSGWVPKDEYQGDPNKWVDADEFVRRGPLFEKINSTNKELKEVRKALEQLKAHHHNVKEAALKEARSQLLAEKRAAYENGDPDKIIEIDDKLADNRDQQRAHEVQVAAEAQAAVQQVINPEFASWVDRNSWYTSSVPMKAFADALGVELHSKGHSPTEVLRLVEARVKDEFPNKFRNPNRDKAAAVEATGKGAGKAGANGYQLDATERAAMERFKRQGIMTEDQYIAELKKIKETK